MVSCMFWSYLLMQEALVSTIPLKLVFYNDMHKPYRNCFCKHFMIKTVSTVHLIHHRCCRGLGLQRLGCLTPPPLKFLRFVCICTCTGHLALKYPGYCSFIHYDLVFHYPEEKKKPEERNHKCFLWNLIFAQNCKLDIIGRGLHPAVDVR